MSADYYVDLTHEISQGFVEHRRQTGMEPSAAHMQLRVHPDDLWKMRQSPSMAYTGLYEPQQVLGIAIVTDTTVTLGHPVLRSTWEMTL